MMAGSRTIKTLTTLLVAMTVGSFALMLMESAPIRPSPSDLAAAIQSSDAGLVLGETTNPPRSWNSIVVHTSPFEREDIAQRCHIVVQADGSLTYTSRWKQQQDGASLNSAELNSGAVAVVVMGKTPTDAQKTSLLRLRETLRDRFDISESRDYNHCDIEQTRCGRVD